MRNSQIVMLSALGVVLLVVVVTVVGIRMALFSLAEGDIDFSDYEENAFNEPFEPDDAVELPTGLTGFRRIQIRDAWSVEIVQGPDWNVEFQVPEGRRDQLNVGVDSDRLVLAMSGNGFGGRGWFGGNRGQNRARITMPDLVGVEIEGAGQVELSGFQGQELRLFIAGAGSIEGTQSRYEELEITISGAGNIQLDEVPVTTANVVLSGAGNVELLMNGGELSGNLSGFGNLEYAGTVSAETVEVSGFARVHPAN
jgi:hypothetical protein